MRGGAESANQRGGGGEMREQENCLVTEKSVTFPHRHCMMCNTYK